MAVDMMMQIKILQKMMKDANFRAFIGHPKVQELVKDPEFMELMKTKDPEKIKNHPKLAALSTEPELKELMLKLDLTQLFT